MLIITIYRQLAIIIHVRFENAILNLKLSSRVEKIIFDF